MCKLNNQIPLRITINFLWQFWSFATIFLCHLFTWQVPVISIRNQMSSKRQVHGNISLPSATGLFQMFTKRSYQNRTIENDLLPSGASWFRCQVLMPKLEKLSSHISLIARHYSNVGKKNSGARFRNLVYLWFWVPSPTFITLYIE